MTSQSTNTVEQPTSKTILWSGKDDPRDFFRVIRLPPVAGELKNVPLRLQLDHYILGAFAELSDDDLTIVLAKIKSYQISDLYVDGIGASFLRTTETFRNRMTCLFQELGAISTLKSVLLPVQHPCSGLVLRYLRHMTRLDLHGRFGAISDEFTAGLTQHPCIERVSLKATDGGFLATFLATLQTLPLLKHVAWIAGSAAVLPADFQAVSSFLRTHQSLLTVDICDANFTEELASMMRASIRSCGLNAIGIHRCNLEAGAVECVDALLSLPLQILRLTEVLFSGENVRASFYSALLPRLASMPHLRELTCQMLRKHEAPSAQQSGVLTQVATTFGDCRDLELICLDCDPTSFKVLVERVVHNTKLKRIKCYCVGDVSAFAFPSFAEEARASFMLQQVDFLSFRRVTERTGFNRSQTEAIANDSVKMVEVVCRLNRSGRIYMTEDPTNKHRGCKLLDTVQDDLDCLYFHMKENPLLCYLSAQSNIEVCSISRKRKAPDS